MNKKEFTFDEKTHTYRLDGKRMTGITTVLGVIAKPALIPWAANMAVDYVKEHGSLEKDGGVNFISIREDILEEARKAHAQKRDKAADVGTLVHKAVEEWINEKKEPKLDEQGIKMFNHFKKWAEDNKVKFLESEKKVYSEEHFVAGTPDFICEIDGRKYLGDFKTSSGIYGREFFWQCAGYRMMLEEMGEKDFRGSIIVRCGKKGDFEVKESFDYESDLKGFMSALTIYRLTKNY